MKGVAVPVPTAEEFHLTACILRPRVSIDQRREESEDNDAQSEETGNQRLSDRGSGSKTEALDAAGDKVKLLAEHQDGEIEGGEVVVQEELTGHQEEWEVVEEPSQNAGTHFIVEALEGGMAVVTTAALPAKNRDTLENQVDANRHSR